MAAEVSPLLLREAGPRAARAPHLRLAALPRLRPSAIRWTRVRAASLLVSGDLAALLGIAAVLPPSASEALYALNVLAVLAWGGAYRPRIDAHGLPHGVWLLQRAALAVLGPVPVFLLADLSALGRLAALTAVALVLARCASNAVIRTARVRGYLREPALIVGAGRVGAELARALTDHREYGLDPVGFVDSVTPAESDLPVVGAVGDLGAILAQGRVRRLIVAFGPTREHELVQALRAAAQTSVDIHVVPRFYDVGGALDGPATDQVRGIPLVHLRPFAERSLSWWAKRTIDAVAAGVALLALAPLLAAVAVAVRLSSPGPVLFRQQRIGRHGRSFELLKFRSMRLNDDSDTQWTVRDDPRRTRLGTLLRRTSIDELPQLWNVLVGDMSLVGPRPERPHFVARYRDEVVGYGDRHRLPVGLTGLAQISGLRGDTSIAERAHLDNQYIEHWSLWRDVVILLRTVSTIVRDAATGRSG